MPTIKLKNFKPAITEKRCYKCGLLLSIDAFAKRSLSSDGYSHECKQCTNKRKARERMERQLIKEAKRIKDEQTEE